jgi:hypothetical protein
MTNSKDLARKVLNLAKQGARRLKTRAHMPKGGGSRRLGNHHHAKEVGNWAGVDPGRSAQAGRPGPFQGPVTSPFDLASIRAIYSPGVESHGSINSSSAAEQQRREGHHLGDERVELVDYGLPSRRGNLACKTTSEFPELEARSR